jgi:hypothetical protein
MIQQVAIGVPAHLREFGGDLAGSIQRLRLVLLSQGYPADTSQQNLEVVGCCDPVRVFLRNGLALFG